MYLWNGTSWRLVIPYLAITNAIISGSSIEVFYQMTADYTGLPFNAQLWKNSVQIAGTTVSAGVTSLWGAVYVPNVNAGDVRSVSSQAPDGAGNVVVQATDAAGTGTSIIVDGGATTANIKLRKVAGGANITISVDANGDLLVSGTASGSVQSVALGMPSIFNVSGSPVTTTGTLTATLSSQNAKTFFSGPASGSANVPAFRAIEGTDLPVATTLAVGGVSVGAGLSVTVGGSLSADVQSFNGRTGAISLQAADVTGVGGALLASPAFTGVPTAPTATTGDNSTTLATTAFVHNALVAFSVPPATTTTLGSVIVKTGLNVDASGDLSVAPATQTGLGGVIVPSGSGLNVDASGNISNAGVTTFNGRPGAVSLTAGDVSTVGGALLAGPAFTGVPTAPTAAPGTNTDQLATTAFVIAAINSSGVSSFNTRIGAVTLQASDVTGVGGALLASPSFTGTPTAPTAAPGTNTDQLATTAFVTAAINASGVSSFNTRTGAVTLQASDVSGVGGALLASPSFTGTPTAPTAAPGTNNTQIATTAFVTAAVQAQGVTSFNTRTGAVTLQLSDVTGVGGAPLASPAFTGAPTTPDINLASVTGTQVMNLNSVSLLTQGVITAAISGSQALTFEQYTYPTVVLGGSPSSPPTITVPNTGRWTFWNTLAFAATMSNGSGATVTIPSGEIWTVFADGVNGVQATNTVAVTQATSDNSQHLATTAFVHSVLNTLGVSSFNGRAGAVTLQASDVTGVGGALLASPAFTGLPTAPTAAIGDNSTTLSTTAFVQNTLLNTVSIPLSNVNETLTSAQYGGQVLEFTGVLTADVTLTVPSSGQWTMYNNTTGSFHVTIANGAGSTYVVPQNESAHVLSIGSLGVINANVAVNVITPATATTLGGVIVPNSGGLSVDASGNLSVAAATGTSLGGVKQGAGVTIAADGTISANVTSVAGRTGAVTLAVADVSGAAPLAGPAFTGVPTAPTAAPGTNTTQLATTAFVQAAIGGASVTSFNTRTGAVTLQASDVTGVGGALLASPAFTGTPTAPTAGVGDNSTTLATTNYVYGATQGLLSISLNGFASANSFSLSPQQYSYSAIEFTGTLGGNPVVTFPSTGKWTVYNQASDGGLGYQVKVNNGAGTTFTLTNGVVYTFLAAGSAGMILIATTATVYTFNNRTGNVTLQAADVTGVGGALLASPAFTGTPTAPTATAGTNTTQLATTAFVQAAVSGITAVTSFNTRTGAVTLQASDVTGVGGLLNASPTITGRTQSDAYSFTVTALGSVSGTQTLNLGTASEWTMTIAGATTIAFTNTLAAGISEVAYLRITNGGSSTITWPAGTQFASGTAPSLTVSGTDLLGVVYDTTTSTYMVFVIGPNVH
jgi:hypothetical protein